MKKILWMMLFLPILSINGLSINGCSEDITLVDRFLPEVWVDSFIQQSELNGMDIIWR